MKWLLALSVFVLLLHAHVVFADNSPSPYVDLADAPTITVDWSKSGTQFVTLHGNRDLVFMNGEKGKHYTLAITQDAAGSRAPNWPASVRCQLPVLAQPQLQRQARRTTLASFTTASISDMLAISQNF